MRLRRYDNRLRRFGLRDRHLDWHVSSQSAWTFAVRELIVGIFLLPLCALGLVVFAVPYQVTGFIARRVTRQHDVIATAQVFTGVVVYGGWLAAIGALVWSVAGRTDGADVDAADAGGGGRRALRHRARVVGHRRGARVVAAPACTPIDSSQLAAPAVRAR